MSESLGLPVDLTGLDGPGSGRSSGGPEDRPGPAEVPRAATRVPLAALAGQVRFALGQDEEKRITNRVGFRIWTCNVGGGYIHTHPILAETTAVLALSAPPHSIQGVSAVIHTRNQKAPDVEYSIVLLRNDQPLDREVLDRIIDGAVRAGGRHAGPDGAAVVSVIPADTPSRIELELPGGGPLFSRVILVVRPGAEIVDHAYATWSDLCVLRAPRALSAASAAGLPDWGLDWAGDGPQQRSVLHDLAGLFDPAWYLASAGKGAQPPAPDKGDLLTEYMGSQGDPWSGLAPHPLFDPAHYGRQVPVRHRELHPLVHYLTTGWKAGLSPHPLFDPAFYAGQAGSLDRPALLHYLQEGWKSGLTPHRLFCPDYFARTAGLSEPLSEAPLVTYLRGKHDGDPHYLFDTQHYRRFQGFPVWDGILMRYAEFNRYNPLPELSDLGNLNSLVHYVQFGSRSRQSPHFLFDADWYASQRQRINELEPPSIDWDPLSDYLEVGVRYRLSPSRLVDAGYYAAQASLADGEDCVGHYMLGTQKDRVSLTPAMDAQFYAWHAPAALDAKSPLHHLLCTPAEERVKTLAIFDPEFYLSEYPDLETDGFCPIVHFVSFGAAENRRPNAVLSDLYCAQHLISSPEDLGTAYAGYLRGMAKKRVRLLFTSHEASRSGAPAIILSLIRGFAEHGNAECFTILDRGGELLPEFKRHSHVMAMSKSVHDVGPHAESHDRDIRQLLDLLGDNPPVVAFVNSAESRHIGERLARHGIPVISLVHETPSYYPPEDFDSIYRASKRVVFPSSYVDENARAHSPYPEGLAMVRGQGLLWPGFGQRDREQARRKVFQELGLGGDAALVIGCGSVNFRKGADAFLSAAAVLHRRLQAKPGHRPVFFCWLGDGPDLDSLRREVRRSKLGHVVRYIGAKADVERYFVAGDLFVLPSRSDPFPCVVHEAMAAGMPVVGFEDGGGGPELFGAEAGVTVPAGEVGKMAEAIEKLVFDDRRRLAMGQAARRIIADRGNNEAYFHDMRTLAGEVTGLDLESALGERRRRNGRKVFFLAPDWGVSGVNSFAESLVNGLNARGYEAEILFTRGRFIHWERDHMGRAALPDAPYSLLQPAQNTAEAIWRELERFLREQAPCVIVPNYDYIASAITPTLNSNVGVVGILHSDDVEHYEHGYRLGPYWNRIVAVSERIERRMLELNPGFRGRSRLLRYGIAAVPDVDVAAKSPGGEDPIQVVYTGRFENYQKGIHRYVMLADQLARSGVKARLVMCGDGSELAAVRTALGGHIRAGRVELTGRVVGSVVKDVLRRSHAFVLLSDFEGLPISMLEAMEAGCVPIVYDMESGIPEVVRSAKNGLIVPHGNLAAVVDAIAGLRADPQAWCRMAAAARQSIRDLKLTQDDMSDGYADLLAGVFGEIEAGDYRRPASLAYRARIDGVLPSPAMYDPAAPLGL